LKFFKGYSPQFYFQKKCDHEFYRVRSSMTDGGMGKMIIYRCKCGKEKVEFI